MDVGTAAMSAWASGISMYFVAAVLGVGGRLDWVDSPAWLQSPWVIGGALALFVVELVVDKLAWLDSTWDAVHTGLRPTAGAILFSTADTVDVRGTAVMAATGAGLALSAHLAKASIRAVANLSPEPVSNVVISLAEDGLVAALMGLALAYPEVALAVAVALTIASSVVAWLLFRTVRRARRRWQERRLQRRVGRRGPPGGPGSASPGGWA
jgi:hypothetical protein